MHAPAALAMNASIDDLIHLGLDHHRAGRLAEAERLYRDALAQEPNHPGALHLLGVIAHQVGRNDVAEQLIRRAIDRAPIVPEFHNNLGEALRHAGKIDEAAESYLRALALDPDNAQALTNLGVVRRMQGRFDESESSLRRAIELAPQSPLAHRQLGLLYTVTRRHDLAAEAYANAAQLDPRDAETQVNLAMAMKESGRLEAAAAACRRATYLRPDWAEAHCNLGAILQAMGRTNEAIEEFTRAIECKPGFAEAYNNLGFSLLKQDRLDEGIFALREAVRLSPSSANAYGNLGNALQKLGRTDEAVDTYRKAIELRPDLRIAHANLLLALNYDANVDPKAVFEEHVRWGERHANHIRVIGPSADHDRDPNRRLRVGYVSPDFWQHSVAFFIEPIIEAHDRQNVEVSCYSDVTPANADAVTDRVRSKADHWIDARGMSDEQLAGRIRDDRIDILIDLAGHTAGNRLLAFARKPAPVQMTYLGYPNTTGVRAIDYRVTDTYADPPSAATDGLHVEKLIRLPRCAWCYRPHDDAPDVAPRPPVVDRGFITFGSFNKAVKLSPATMETWAKLLAAVPNSRLVIKSVTLRDERGRQYRQEMLERHGIDPSRLQVVGKTHKLADHLRHYHEIDIALDTFPYNGTTTTCDALWMGVPVVALAGDRHVARVGVSLLSNVGLPELIASSPDDYVEIAATFARDRDRLVHLRQTLRERMRQSPLMDARGLARDLETAYRHAWTTWCAAGRE